jgi:hypothetical protein
VSPELASLAQPQFQEIIDQFTVLSARANGVTRDLQTHQLNLRPEPHRWSIAECLVHLTLCSTAYLEIDKVVASFVDLQSALIKSVESANGLDLNRIKINSPSSSRVSFNLFSCYHIVAAHERRHLNQAEETRRDIEQ